MTGKTGFRVIRQLADGMTKFGRDDKYIDPSRIPDHEARPGLDPGSGTALRLAHQDDRLGQDP